MNVKAFRSLLSVATLAALVAGATTAWATPETPAAVAAARVDATESRSYRYQLKALGGHVGEAILTVGATEKIGGKRLRAVSMEARTEGFAATVFKTQTSSTSWVDEVWLPIRARWDAMIPTGKRLVKARYDGRKLDGEDFRDGKLKHKLKRTLPKRTNDLLSIFPWLAHGPLEPGRKFETSVYDGIRIYNLSAVVGAPEQVTVPAGVRTAWPIRIAVTRGKYKRDLTYWVGTEDRTPYKLLFDFGLLGSVEALLVSEKRS